MLVLSQILQTVLWPAASPKQCGKCECVIGSRRPGAGGSESAGSVLRVLGGLHMKTFHRGSTGHSSIAGLQPGDLGMGGTGVCSLRG